MVFTHEFLEDNKGNKDDDDFLKCGFLWLEALENGTNKSLEDIAEFGGKIEEVPAGTFKESGTNIATCIVIINKI